MRAGRVPIYEPGLSELVLANHASRERLLFTTSLKEAGRGAKAIFIAVGTPSLAEVGSADMHYVHDAARAIAEVIEDFAVVVVKSTVPIGAGDEVERIIAERVPRDRFAVVSNPEFLREGAAIEDFKEPDRVVIGVDDERAREVMRDIYQPIERAGGQIVYTSRRSSEMIKYAANVFLAMKVTFINEIADLCERLDADVMDVSRGIGLDDRIGAKFLNPGPGFGGSCFPKDTLALTKLAIRGEGADPAGRDAGGRQREAQSGDGREGRQSLRRFGRRQADRRSGAHLQAEDRRHARRAEPCDHSGVAGRRRANRRLRP